MSEISSQWTVLDSLSSRILILMTNKTTQRVQTTAKVVHYGLRELGSQHGDPDNRKS